MTLYLAAPPEKAKAACATGFPLALMAYRPGHGFHLYRTPIPDVRPALIYVDCSDFSGFGPHRLLGGEIMGECIARGADGIILDILSFEEPVKSFCSCLAHACDLNGLKLYLPYLSGNHIEGTVSIVSSDVDSGSLEAALRSVILELGHENVALQADRAFRVYPLPCRTGVRRDVTGITPQGLLLEKNAKSFFSKELCVNYFLYFESNRIHMALYDDKTSITEKLRLAAALGITEAFLCYPQAEDIAKRLREP